MGEGDDDGDDSCGVGASPMSSGAGLEMLDAQELRSYNRTSGNCENYSQSNQDHSTE